MTWRNAKYSTHSWVETVWSTIHNCDLTQCQVQYTIMTRHNVKYNKQSWLDANSRGRFFHILSQMFKLAVFALAVTLASASLEANWLVYKRTHNKTYSEDEDVLRRLIWQANLQKIERHNELYAAGKSSFFLGQNQFADMVSACGLKASVPRHNLKEEKFLKNVNFTSCNSTTLQHLKYGLQLLVSPYSIDNQYVFPCFFSLYVSIEFIPFFCIDISQKASTLFSFFLCDDDSSTTLKSVEHTYYLLTLCFSFWVVCFVIQISFTNPLKVYLIILFLFPFHTFHRLLLYGHKLEFCKLLCCFSPFIFILYS